MQKLNTIDEAIEDIKAGKVVIVVDDENRENEGDFVAAASLITPEIINFMAKHGRGLICAPITESRCKELELNLMTGKNTDPLGTAFTISIDYKYEDFTTGISAFNRASTVKALTNANTKAIDFVRPGHIFPLKAREGGVLRRTGHTEAAIDLARLAGLFPAGAIVEIMNEDGTMARLPQLFEIAEKFKLKVISIEDLVEYRMQRESLIELVHEGTFENHFGEFNLKAYKQTTNGQVHLSLTKGTWQRADSVLVKIYSNPLGNDLLGSLTSDAFQKLHHAFEEINIKGKGAVVLINQEIEHSLLDRIKMIANQQQKGNSLAKEIRKDEKDYGIGAQILNHLNITKPIVLSNAKKHEKPVGLHGYGIEIEGYQKY
jgi:3,4-dihydroxy 2-butanone 4-phosphate synthase/GTP cyclohydrolase II